VKRFRRIRKSCARCSNGFLEHARLGRIRCPDCTKPKPTPAGLKLLTASEKRRQEQAALSQSIKPATLELNLPGVPLPLVTTDRILSRWGFEGTGEPSDDPDAYHEAKPPPLDPATYVEVNRIVMGAKRDDLAIPAVNDRQFAIDFYRASNPALALKKWGVSPREIRRIREGVLQRYRVRFKRSKHTDLLTLVNFIPEGA
jgi:hypothetical protein